MPESGLYTMILALMFVLALMGILLIILKHFGIGGGVPTVSKSARRLHILEILPLGPQHRAVLMKKDETEHLVILGPHGATPLRKEEGTKNDPS